MVPMVPMVPRFSCTPTTVPRNYCHGSMVCWRQTRRSDIWSTADFGSDIWGILGTIQNHKSWYLGHTLNHPTKNASLILIAIARKIIYIYLYITYIIVYIYILIYIYTHIILYCVLYIILYLYVLYIYIIYINMQNHANIKGPMLIAIDIVSDSCAPRELTGATWCVQISCVVACVGLRDRELNNSYLGNIILEFLGKFLEIETGNSLKTILSNFPRLGSQ